MINRSGARIGIGLPLAGTLRTERGHEYPSSISYLLGLWNLSDYIPQYDLISYYANRTSYRFFDESTVSRSAMDVYVVEVFRTRYGLR